MFPGVEMRGFEGLRYDDSVASAKGLEEGRAPIRFDGEVDRIYYGAPAELYIVGTSAGRALRVRTDGFPDAVVWNIGRERASSLPDLGEGEWEKYVCLEAACIGNPVSLRPGKVWDAAQSFTAIAADEVPGAAL